MNNTFLNKQILFYNYLLLSIMNLIGAIKIIDKLIICLFNNCLSLSIMNLIGATKFMSSGVDLSSTPRRTDFGRQ